MKKQHATDEFLENYFMGVYCPPSKPTDVRVRIRGPANEEHAILTGL